MTSLILLCLLWSSHIWLPIYVTLLKRHVLIRILPDPLPHFSKWHHKSPSFSDQRSKSNPIYLFSHIHISKSYWLPPKWVFSPPLHCCNSNLSATISYPDLYKINWDFPSGSASEEPTYQCRICNFWVGKIPWSSKWKPAPVFLPGKFRGQRTLAGYSPWGQTQRVRHDWVLAHTHVHQFFWKF